MSDFNTFPAPPEGEPAGDVGDQAQRLQAAEEAEAIAAALGGHPTGDDELDRPAPAQSFGEEPVDRSEIDGSDDPFHAGEDQAEPTVGDEAERLGNL